MARRKELEKKCLYMYRRYHHCIDCMWSEAKTDVRLKRSVCTNPRAMYKLTVSARKSCKEFLNINKELR